MRLLIDHVRRAQLPLCVWCTAIPTLILWLSFPVETFLFWPWSFELGALRPPIPLSSRLASANHPQGFVRVRDTVDDVLDDPRQYQAELSSGRQ